MLRVNCRGMKGRSKYYSFFTLDILSLAWRTPDYKQWVKPWLSLRNQLKKQVLPIVYAIKPDSCIYPGKAPGAYGGCLGQYLQM